MLSKFKTRQIVLVTDSPNLMFAKVSRYTIYFTLEIANLVALGNIRMYVCLHVDIYSL